MSDFSELFGALMDTTSEPIFVVDSHTQSIIEANAAAAEHARFPYEELRGHTICEVFQHEDGSPICSVNEWAGSHRLQCLRLLKRGGGSVLVAASATRFRKGVADLILLITQRHEEEVSIVCPVAAAPNDFPTIIGRSIKIRDVCRLIGSCAKTDVTVLIQGDSGTGKEIVANAIHAHSNRHRGQFVKVNCAALTETLLESELFGHVKGAFTGALRDRQGRFKQAHGGTILLDEIGSMSITGQAKLLRVLQEHELEPVGSSVTIPVDVRVIAATNADLTRAVTEGKFREDLYYRLNVFQILLPPLRERKEDVLMLAHYFLSSYSKAIGKPIRGFAQETLNLLVKHNWPGNVRELENAIEHAVIVESGPEILPASLPVDLRRDQQNCTEVVEPSLRDRLTALEKQMLVDALIRANGVKKRAAEMLQVDARNLPYLLRKHDLSVEGSADAKLH
jgi:transcriptional regulator with PAS, ATPase and Fis domain